MPNVSVAIDLPYILALPDGHYPTQAAGLALRLDEVWDDATGRPNTAVALSFVPEDGADVELTRVHQAQRLLRLVNRLLRWYRVAANQPTIIELTRAQASPFRFIVDGASASWGGEDPLEFEPALPRPPRAGRRAEIVDIVRMGLVGGADPDVATLNLLDAEYALSVGRFREAVLLCWSVIDSTFVRKFSELVDDRLKDEWSEGRKFVKGHDFGLRQKMTAGLYLLTGRSLYAEPAGFWNKLSANYDLRNKIIHEGSIAEEDQAIQAIEVARTLVQILATLDTTTANNHTAPPPASNDSTPSE